MSDEYESPTLVDRNGGGYRERGFGGGGAERYGPDYGTRRGWNDDPSYQRRELSPEGRERLLYERERERALYERERYERDARHQQHPDAPYGRAWRGPPSAREAYDYRGEAVRDPRDPFPPAASRYPLDPRERQREEDRFGSRLPPAAPRYEQRDSFYGRERERDAYGQRNPSERMYDRQDRDALYRDDRRQSPPMLRYGSPPTSSHRSSPSASRRPSPPQQPAGQQSQPAPPHPSNPRMLHRDSTSDQTQVAQIDAPPQQPPTAPSALVPTGPRRGYSQAPPYGGSAVQHQQSAPVPAPNRAPPTGPRASLEGGGSGLQGRTYDRSPYGEGSSGQTQQQQAPFRREGFGRESTSHLHFPAQSSGPAGGAPASSSGPTTPVVPLTPASASRRSTWTDAETRGSVEEKGRAEPDPWQSFDVSLERIRSAQTTFAHPTMVALRKALSDLANSDVELAGARFKTSVTEAALEKAKEEAEAWSIETARIELEQRNGGLESYWHTPTSSIPTPAP